MVVQLIRELDTSTSFSNREEVRAREPVSFWREKRGSRRHFTTSFSENGVVAKTTRNVGDLVFMESQNGSFETTTSSSSLTTSKMKLPGRYLFLVLSKNSKSTLVFEVVLVLES